MDKIEMEQSGDNSVQIGEISGGNVNIYYPVIDGLTEKRAEEIFDERLKYLLLSYSTEAHNIAIRRNKNFMNKFIRNLVKENMLDCLIEPSIQILLMEAQKIAASTEEDFDYQLLSDILFQRIKNNDKKFIKANVSYAINVIDKLSIEALLGLTLIYAIRNIIPKSGYISNGLDELNANISILIGDKKLPDETYLEWLYELEMLNLIHFRTGTVGTEFVTLIQGMLPGYMASGIPKNSNKYLIACEKLKTISLSSTLLVSHEFNKGFVRLPITFMGDIDRLQYRSKFLSNEQRIVVREIYNSYTDDLNTDELTQQPNIKIWQKFNKEFLKRPHLKRIHTWGEAFPYEVEVTLVGCILGYTNAKYYLKNLSPYDGAFGECFNDIQQNKNT